MPLQDACGKIQNPLDPLLGKQSTTMSEPLAPEIDLYCERVSAFVFDEPLGLTSNLSFFIAAIALSRPSARQQAKHWILIAWLIAIGIGSGLFHAYATRLTLWLDVLPIQGFILSAMWILYRDHLHLSRVATGLVMVGFVIGSSLVPSWLLNGSASYLPAWLMLVIAALAHPTGSARQDLVKAASLFPISLTFRTLDLPLCEQWSYGTHFLWHIGNALVLFWIVRATQRQTETERHAFGDAARDGYTPSEQRITDHETR